MYTIGNMSRGYAAPFSHYIDNLVISDAPLL